MLDILERVVRYCEGQGAEAEAMGVQRSEIIVTVERNDIKLCMKQRTAGVGIRTSIKNSVGFSSCNSFDETILKETAERAIKISRKTPPLPFSVFAPPDHLREVPGLYDPEVHTFDEEAAILAAERMITAAREDPCVSVDNGEFTASLRNKAIATSSGISFQERKSLFSWFLFGLAAAEGEVSPYEFQYGCTTHVKELYLEETARMMAHRAAADLNPRKIDSFSGEVILAPEAVSAIVGDSMAFSLNASNVHRGQSVLRGKLNEKVASDLVTVRDDAISPGDYNSSAFDREGTPHQTVILVEKGVLKRYLYDTLAANRESRPSTGNAVGTFREIPKIGITNFSIDRSSSSIEDMVTDINEGLLICRFSGTSDPISGDFSGAVKGSHCIRKGEIQYPVKEATIAGNVSELLQKVSHISEETMRYPRMMLPYMKITEMKVTA